MNQLDDIFGTLKHLLKQQNITYKILAEQLDMSEANVKRMFSLKQCSLQRLEAICQELDLTITDLFLFIERQRERLVQLSHAQEQELIDNPKLFLVAACTRDGWKFEDIIEHYDIDKFECVQLMARLDKLKIIQLLPGNTYRMLISQDFKWIENGPLEKFMASQGIPHFLNGNFATEDSTKFYIRGTFSQSSINEIERKLNLLKKDIAALNHEDANLPINKRQHIGVLLAMRPWELPIFKSLRRTSL